MNHLRMKLACMLLAAALLGQPGCKDDSTGTPSAEGGAGGQLSQTGGNATGGATPGEGGRADSSGTLATGGATRAGGTTGGSGAGGAASSGTGPGSGGAPRSGGAGSGTAIGAGGATGGRTTSASGGSGGAKATGGSTSSGGATGKGGATGSGGGTSAAAGLTLYYIRHAEVVANVVDPSEITMDNMDALTDLGVRQIEALTPYLQGLGIMPDAVLVSPHVRTQRTIAPYLAANQLTGEVWMELAETTDKSSTGAPLPDAPKFYSFYKATLEVENLVFRDPSATSFWQNDTYEAGLLMVTTAKNNLLERYGRSGKTVFVVGHAIAGQMLIGLLRGEDLIGGPTTSGAGAVYLLNTGVMRLLQDPDTGLFKLDGRNVNNPPTK
jgi:broad specificity phosphatase PhoE